MRGLIEGAPTAHPLGEMLPAVYADDWFAQQFTAALDEVAAPVLTSLDCFDAYLDPAVAPEDYVDWLADWVALPLEEGWSVERRRKLVSVAVALHRSRGTRGGLAALIEIVTGGRVEIAESGGCVASPEPGGALPGSDQPRLHVRVAVPDPRALSFTRIDALIAANKPAHLPHTLEIVPDGVSEKR